MRQTHRVDNTHKNNQKLNIYNQGGYTQENIGTFFVKEVEKNLKKSSYSGVRI